MMGTHEADLSGAAAALREALEAGRPVAALTGAGVSAESGIPTFRGAGGLWKGFRAEELATPGAFQRDPAKVWEWYTWRRDLVLQAEPNPGHLALAALERAHQNFTLITQNVDGLHQRAGSRRVVELHGNIHHARCLDCGHVASLPEPKAGALEASDGAEDADVSTGPGCEGSGGDGADGVRRGVGEEGVPRCVRCGGGTRPHIVWFGEMLPEEPWRHAYAAAAGAAVLLVVGTSAAVYPAAGLVDVTLAGGGAVVEINPQATDVSERVTWSLRTPAGEALPELLQRAEVQI